VITLSSGFLYFSILFIWVLLLISIYFRPLKLSVIIIGITTIAYSILFDIFFGEISGLYYYINKDTSLFYLVISAVLLYAPLNIVYTLFLPRRRKTILLYTGAWIAVMHIFEYASLRAGTVVFTGWKAIPWSFMTYVFTYSWIYFFYNYLSERISKKQLRV